MHIKSQRTSVAAANLRNVAQAWPGYSGVAVEFAAEMANVVDQITGDEVTRLRIREIIDEVAVKFPKVSDAERSMFHSDLCDLAMANSASQIADEDQSALDDLRLKLL